MFGNDEHYYARAAEEIAGGEVRPGLWAKALAETDYDEPRARARYLKLRVRAMKVEVAEAARLVRDQERAMQRQAEERKTFASVWGGWSTLEKGAAVTILLSGGWALLAPLLLTLTTPAHAERSSAERLAFVSSHPCPATGQRHGRCPGYIVDHIVPLACGGADAPENMQWQTRADALAKDRWERNACK